MQIHFDKACFDSYGTPWFNGHNPDKPFAHLSIGPVDVSILNEEEADQLIAVACQIKDMFRQHTAMRSPIWAVVDSLEGEVAGPMTHADAEAYIKENASYFIGDLAIETAKPDDDTQGGPKPCGWTPARGYVHYAHAGCPGAELDAALSPPEPGALSDAERDEATTPPGHQMPDGAVNEEQVPPGEQCSAKADYPDGRDESLYCWRRKGHSSPWHSDTADGIQWMTGGDGHVTLRPYQVPAGTDAR
jgi:hypothetical protein